MNIEARPRRQPIRLALIIASFLLFPITLNYFSPAMIIMAASAGVLSGSACVFLAQFVSALFFGRSFCGWICPGAGLQEACLAAQPKAVNGARCDWIKYAIFVPWVGLIVYFLATRGLRSADFFFMMESPVSVDEPSRYPIYLTVIGLIFVLSLSVGRRAFCHTGCWMSPFMVLGTLVQRRLRIPSLHLRPAPDKCVHCRDCNGSCPMSLDVTSMVARGDMFSTECVLCGTCVDTCRQHAIRYSFGRATRIRNR
jgi:ferredoxin-type protein NapH